MWIEILITDWLMHGTQAFLVSFLLALLTGIIYGSLSSRLQTLSISQGYKDVLFILLVFSCCTLWLFLLGLQHLSLDGMF